MKQLIDDDPQLKEIWRLQRNLGSLNLNGETEEVIDVVRKELAELYFQRGDFWSVLNRHAQWGSINEKDKNRIREIGVRSNDPEIQGYAFSLLRDDVNLLPALECLRLNDCDSTINDVLEIYLGSIVWNRFAEGVKCWASEKGVNMHQLSIDRSIVMAYELASKYDVGVGIAKGGLGLAYATNLFGLDTRIVESHSLYRGRIRKKTTFEAHDDISDIEGKRVLVLDNDTVRGLTLKKVGDELKKLNPDCIDVAFVHNPVGPGGLGTIAESIPKEIYGEIYFPQDFRYTSFAPAIR